MNKLPINASSQCMTWQVRIRTKLALLIAMAASPAGAAGLDAQVLAGSCVNCHGPEGRSPGAIPPIAGLAEDALKAKLIAFKSETPPAGTTIMNRLAKGYSDAQIADLARYYARMKPAAAVSAGAKP